MITIETPGFTSTPLTKAVICVSLTLSIVGKLFGIEDAFVFDPTKGLDIPKIVLSSVFLDLPHVIFSVSLFTYWLRTLERHIGTRRVAVVGALAWAFYVALCVVEAFVASIFNVKLTTSCGTHWYMYSLLMLYKRYIPEPRKARVFNRKFPAKKLMYLTIMHHNLISLPHGVTGIIAGIVAGSLYTHDAFGLTKVEVPEWVAAAFSSWAIPMLGMEKHNKNNNFQDSKIETANNNNNNMDQRPIPYEADRGQEEEDGVAVAAVAEDEADRQQEEQGEGDNVNANVDNNNNDGNDNGTNSNNSNNNSGSSMLMNFLRGVEPNPHAVQALVAMGFDEELVRDALIRSDNNVEVAAGRLLDGVQ